MIVADGIGKTFDDVVAVEALSLDIAAGEVFGFLGPNGAGKTTTIRMLTSLIAPTTGTAMGLSSSLPWSSHSLTWS
jgi:ABC-2 type transport system ATP-binding protein